MTTDKSKIDEPGTDAARLRATLEFVRVEFPWHKTEAYCDHRGMRYRWRPGVRWFDAGDGDLEAVADGVGAMLIAEVGRYTPPGFQERVFYVRQWETPTGEIVGNPRKLKVMGAAGFTRLRRSYRYSFDLTDALASVPMGDPPLPEDLADAVSY